MPRQLNIEIRESVKYLEKSLRNARTASQKEKLMKAVVAQERASQAAPTVESPIGAQSLDNYPLAWEISSRGLVGSNGGQNITW